MLQEKPHTYIQVSSVHFTLVGWYYLGGYTTYFYGDYKTAIVRIPINQLVFHGMPHMFWTLLTGGFR